MQNETLRTALTLHQRGELDQAAQLYRQILASEPNHPDALHLLGLAFLQRGETRTAIDLIGRAAGLMPSQAIFHANLAEAYRLARQFDLAFNCCATAIRLQPDYPQVHNSLGLVYMDQGRAAESARHFQEAIRLAPDFALAYNNLGNAYRLVGEIPQAIAHLRRAVELDNNLAMAHTNLGQLLLERRELNQALEHAQAAVRLQPGGISPLNNMGNVLRELGRLSDAKICYSQALRLNPNIAMIHNNIGQALGDEGATDEAIRWYQQAINLEPNTPRFHVNLGAAFQEKNDSDKAVACYQQALRVDPGYADAYNGLGWSEHERGRFEEAKNRYREALRLKPDLAQAHCNLGQVLEELNDLAGAETHLREALRHDPRNNGAYARLATLLRGKMPEAELQGMQQLTADPLLSEGKRAALLFGLAQVFDGRGDYDRASECLGAANPLELNARRQRGQGWNPESHTRFVDQLLATFTPELFDRLSGLGADSERLVFIVGLPRSGTTLLEQILASHSQVHGAGELLLARADFEALAPDGNESKCFEALERLDRAGVERLAIRHLEKLHALNAVADRVTDKMPDNYMYLGLLSILFPQAKFIHCRRDLRDVAVSCWMTNFRQIRWANDLEHIAVRFREYRRIMDHWAQVLPASVLEIDYEETVQDLEDVARRMVSWCGLDWEPACLEYHRNDRPVRTASVTQVRQPVYTRSVARWKHYEPALGPLFRELESLGALDLVETQS